jgi:hypothetical protein
VGGYSCIGSVLMPDVKTKGRGLQLHIVNNAVQ